MSYQDINSKIIDSWCEDGWTWGQPITHEEYEKALAGEWGVLLTPTKMVPKEQIIEIVFVFFLGNWL